MRVEHEHPSVTVRRRFRDDLGAEAPEEPGRFSMTIVAPSFCCMPGCAMRAIGSTLPPGGNGTMILMIPDGQECD